MKKSRKRVSKILDKAEPKFNPNKPVGRSELIRALNWYSQNYTIAKTKSWIWDWMESDELFTEKDIRKLKDSSKAAGSSITQTLASSCKILANGCNDPRLLQDVRDRIRIALCENPIQDQIPTTDSEPRPETETHIQDYNRAIADIDNQLDIFYKKEYQGNYDHNGRIYTLSELQDAHKYYEELRRELRGFREGYQHLEKEQKANYILFLGECIKNLNKDIKKLQKDS